MSDPVAILAGVVVGAVLMIVGLSKLRTRTWGVLALDMGVPRPVVVTLPAAEVLLGLALVLRVAQPFAQWAAVALFGAFTVIVAGQYFSGAGTSCNCFGGRASGPVGPWTILRNAGLLALALVATT